MPISDDIPSFEVLRTRALGLLRSLYAWGWSPEDWEDMAQEVLLKVIKAQGTGRLPPQHFEAWFTTVVRNVATDFWHARHGPGGKRTYVPLEETSKPEDARQENALTQIRAKHDVEAILDHAPGLQRHERAILKLIYYYDFSYRDVADVFGAPEGTVRAWVSRTLNKLRQYGGIA